MATSPLKQMPSTVWVQDGKYVGDDESEEVPAPPAASDANAPVGPDPAPPASAGSGTSYPRQAPVVQAARAGGGKGLIIGLVVALVVGGGLLIAGAGGLAAWYFLPG
ncbi:MAG: hypothetical protein JXX28_00720 [Deltaproteobacteria bacterium]|nr:hypothetical protein [Deltaproteobacteria bacterium]